MTGCRRLCALLVVLGKPRHRAADREQGSSRLREKPEPGRGGGGGRGAGFEDLGSGPGPTASAPCLWALSSASMRRLCIKVVCEGKWP